MSESDGPKAAELIPLESVADGLDVIIAMPDAGNSWYVNSASHPADKYEDYITRDFVIEIDSHFRTIADRHARYIAGLSMGGYASVYFSVKHSDLFSYVGAISAALSAPLDLDDKVPDFKEGLQSAFGPRCSPGRASEDVFSLLDHANPGQLAPIYLDCGEDDMFLAVNRQLAALLQSRKMAYQYHEFPGAHTWQYWDGAIQRFLHVLTEANLVHREKKAAGS